MKSVILTICKRDKIHNTHSPEIIKMPNEKKILKKHISVFVQLNPELFSRKIS
jgi:hypothetical protein